MTDILNPATGEVVGTVPLHGATETRAAIDAAAATFPAWRSLTAQERSSILQKLHGLLLENQETLAQLITAEQGKPLAEARGEVAYAAGYVEWFAEEAKRVYGDIIPGHQQDRRLLVLKQPVGVVACITPWNYPLAMLARKIAPALAAGCTVVCKPAPQTPLSALSLRDLAYEAGVPEDAFTVVTGPAEEIGAELTSNPLVRKLTFTGSTSTGRLLLEQCADTVKKVSLELGGNAPFIVFDDVDLDKAVAGLITAKFRNTGQTCVCANRIFVHEKIYAEFAQQLTSAVADMTVGNGVDDVDLGPLIDQAAVEKTAAHIADAVNQGATVTTGGKAHQLGGTFYEPTVLAGVTTGMRVAQEETFGPVAPLIRFSNEAEVVAMANDTEYGLAAYLYTNDLGRSWRVTEALEYGMVGLNTGIISTEVAPFGGVKQSGIGREGSKYGLDDYLEMKYLCIAGVDE